MHLNIYEWIERISCLIKLAKCVTCAVVPSANSIILFVAESENYYELFFIMRTAWDFISSKCAASHVLAIIFLLLLVFFLIEKLLLPSRESCCWTATTTFYDRGKEKIMCIKWKLAIPISKCMYVKLYLPRHFSACRMNF